MSDSYCGPGYLCTSAPDTAQCSEPGVRALSTALVPQPSGAENGPAALACFNREYALVASICLLHFGVESQRVDYDPEVMRERGIVCDRKDLVYGLHKLILTSPKVTAPEKCVSLPISYGKYEDLDVNVKTVLQS